MSSEEETDAAVERSLIVIRLYLIRHAQSEANVDGIVAGQMESPLTDHGREQANELGRRLIDSTDSSLSSSLLDLFVGTKRKTDHDDNNDLSGEDRQQKINDTERPSSSSRIRPMQMFVSDMGRTQETARCMMCGIQSSSACNSTSESVVSAASSSPDEEPNQVWKNDSRLREQAKGAREGMLKSTTLEQALNDRRRKQEDAKVEELIPLLESEDDVWNRVQEWLSDIVKDSKQEQMMMEATSSSSSSSLPTTSEKTKSAAVASIVQPIMAVTHSGTIRVLCHRLIPDELSRQGYSIDPVSLDGASPSHLRIPNTSVTVVDLHIPLNEKEREELRPNSSSSFDWKRHAQLRQLRWTIESTDPLLGFA